MSALACYRKSRFRVVSIEFAIVTRYVHFEGLESHCNCLAEYGFECRYFDIWIDDF